MPSPSWPHPKFHGSVRRVPPPRSPVEGALANPLTLTFDAGPDHVADVAVVWRHDSEVGWYPIAVGDPGTAAVANRSQFSPHQPGWADVKKWLTDR